MAIRKQKGKVDVSEALTPYEELQAFYSALPYEVLRETKELYPLVAVKRLLDDIGELLKAFEKPGDCDDAQYLLRFIHVRSIGISELLDIYDSSVCEVARELKNTGVEGWMLVPPFKPDSSRQTTLQTLLEENGLLEMKKMAAELMRYYFKGMGGALTMINSGAADYILDWEIEASRLKDRGLILEGLELVKKSYDGILFENLHGDPRYYPLFLGKLLVARLETRINELLADEKPNALHLKHVCAVSNTLQEIGELYSNELDALLARIHATPDGKGFALEVNDLSGRTWHLYDTSTQYDNFL